jgi:hypothetical protein
MHRLDRLPDGKICYELKTPYKNGTTHVVFEPLDLTDVTSDYKIKKNQSTAIDAPQDREECRSKMSWAMRLKRVFNIDVTVCRHC